MASRVFTFCRSGLIYVTLIALVMIGFGHRTSETPLTPELAAYVAAGGVLSDICGTGEGEAGSAFVDCEACRISDAFDLTGYVNTLPAVTTQRTYTFEFVAKRLAQRQSLDAARLVRAPPLA